MGNTLNDGANQYSYDGRGRLVQVANNQGVTPYVINGLGQRIAKLTAPGSTTGTYFYYDEAGHLIGEYAVTGNAIEETVYLGDMPVGVLIGKTNYFIYADHLNAPRAITDSKGKPVWQWEGNPFGNTLPNENPDGKGQGFTYNLRFPGQYFDKETGLHYNGFRDYNPNTGRYVESDPIGLAGGINSYTYSGNNSVSFTDPDGKIVIGIVGVVVIAASALAIADSLHNAGIIYGNAYIASQTSGNNQAGSEAFYRDIAPNVGAATDLGNGVGNPANSSFQVFKFFFDQTYANYSSLAAQSKRLLQSAMSYCESTVSSLYDSTRDRFENVFASPTAPNQSSPTAFSGTSGYVPSSP